MSDRPTVRVRWCRLADSLPGYFNARKASQRPTAITSAMMMLPMMK
jgi:hypothetical protein